MLFFLMLIWIWTQSVCCHGNTNYIYIYVCKSFYKMCVILRDKTNVRRALQYFSTHLNKCNFSMFCCWIISSLKVDSRSRNDVKNVFAIMIINGEHKATKKRIKLRVWNRHRYVDTEEQQSLDKYRWTQVVVNLERNRRRAERSNEVKLAC